ncbi:MAG: CYTH domain-containing protein [Armatimonadota bacterium]|nr:CYTH domain-containing protein [Armatimonadota bacterium]MDR7440218.1 CYTH domain-containing protein [Armatimonadota bacterium]MDR7563988.1 CYTH domain-containing protein [Armatimonadota bacterium]MDR7568206.1 CYTH domain-containing protein [Armatimonadota bacterium]MDR7602817.1 CYTH domain-containing protein [Armatimonadota bacterium]
MDRFEIEVRFPVPDPQALALQAGQLGAVTVLRYAFTDQIYRPRVGPWDLFTRTLRLRAHREPEEAWEVLFSRVEVVHKGSLGLKRSVFPGGKVRLYAGSREACERLLEELGFVPWFEVAKSGGTKWSFRNGVGLALEHVEGLGWMGELEAEGAVDEAIERVHGLLERLAVPPESVTPLPLPVLVARARGLLLPHEESGPPPSNPTPNSGGGGHEGRDTGGAPAQ